MGRRLIFRYPFPRLTMRGRSPRRPVRNGYKPGAKGGPDRKVRRPACLEKPLRTRKRSVPQTDTGGQEENSQALG